MSTLHAHGASLASVVCPRCESPLTAPIAPIPDDRLLVNDGWDPWVPQGTWALADRLVSSMDILALAFPVRVHPHDLLGEQLKVSRFGCCGYAPNGDAPNLHCHCGAPVGIFVDECSCRLQARLVANWAESNASVIIDDIPARLDRCERFRLSPIRVYPDTQWDCRSGAGRDHHPSDLVFSLSSRPPGLVATLAIDGASNAFRLPPAELSRAIALRRLPIGNEWLSLSYGLRDEKNQVISSLCLVSHGDDVEVRFEEGGHTKVCRIWEEWLQYKWADGVNNWLTSTAE